MKHLLLLTSFLSITGLFAQNPTTVTIINSNDVAYIGYEYEYQTDTTTSTFNPGAGGSGWTTDFTTLANDEMETISIEDISQTQYAGLYPMADLVFTNSYGILAIAAKTPNALSIVDEINPAFQGLFNFHYILPDTLLNFNVDLNDEWDNNSSFCISMYFGGDPGNGTIADSMRTISVKEEHVIVDGEGICITEAGTYTTLRLQTTGTITDYVEFYQNGTWVSFGMMNQTTTLKYTWWAKNSGLWVGNCEIDPSTGDILNVSRMTSSTTTTGIEDSQSSGGIQVYPNPANDMITVEYSGGQEQLEFTDLTGRVVKTIQINSPVTSISLTDLPNGMYTYRVVGTNQQGKVQVAH